MTLEIPPQIPFLVLAAAPTPVLAPVPLSPNYWPKILFLILGLVEAAGMEPEVELRTPLHSPILVWRLMMRMVVMVKRMVVVV